jgi:hypothetical protein
MGILIDIEGNFNQHGSALWKHTLVLERDHEDGACVPGGARVVVRTSIGGNIMGDLHRGTALELGNIPNGVAYARKLQTYLENEGQTLLEQIVGGHTWKASGDTWFHGFLTDDAYKALCHIQEEIEVITRDLPRYVSPKEFFQKMVPPTYKDERLLQYVVDLAGDYRDTTEPIDIQEFFDFLKKA